MLFHQLQMNVETDVFPAVVRRGCDPDGARANLRREFSDRLRRRWRRGDIVFQVAGNLHARRAELQQGAASSFVCAKAMSIFSSSACAAFGTLRQRR